MTDSDGNLSEGNCLPLTHRLISLLIHMNQILQQEQLRENVSFQNIFDKLYTIDDVLLTTLLFFLHEAIRVSRSKKFVSTG